MTQEEKNELIFVLNSHKEQICRFPKEFQDEEGNVGILDIRLAYFEDRYGIEDGYQLFVGSSDYDDAHGNVCAANCLTKDSDVEELVEEIESMKV